MAARLVEVTVFGMLSVSVGVTTPTTQLAALPVWVRGPCREDCCRPTPLIVTVTRGGLAAHVGSHSFTDPRPASLTQWLAELSAILPDQRLALVKVEDAVPLQELVTALDAVHAAGLDATVDVSHQMTHD